MKERRIIEVEEKLPILQTLPLSLQHLFAMFGATVLVPFLLNGACQATWVQALPLFLLSLPLRTRRALRTGTRREASLLLGSVSSLWAFL